MVLDRLQRTALQGLMKTPRPVLERLSSITETHPRPHLDPHTRFLLALNSARTPMSDLPADQARRLYSEIIGLLDVRSEAVARVQDHQVPVEDDRILVREYRPAKAPAEKAPAILYFHGGGFTVGSVADYDPLCRFIANRTGAMVISVDYRLAPEAPSPTAAEDSLCAWRWLLNNAEALNLDRSRLAVMGDSAGGNLSAVVCQLARAQDLPLPALQVLIYPTTDARHEHPSVQQLGQGFGLDLDLMHWFREHYLTDPALVLDYRVSPLLQSDFAGLPPAILVTATDPLRDEGIEYGQTLREAGVQVQALDFPDLVHGFMTMGGVIPAARRAVQTLCDATARAL